MSRHFIKIGGPLQLVVVLVLILFNSLVALILVTKINKDNFNRKILSQDLVALKCCPISKLAKIRENNE